MADKPTPRPIVVGVDGSDPSKQALRWALRQAHLTGDTVHAVMAWDYPTSYYDYLPEYGDGDDTLEDMARTTLTEALNEIAGPQPDITARATVIEGNPAQVLLDAARDAALLVVGHRGRGAFARALLGSVSSRCVYHATCPVVVMR